MDYCGLNKVISNEGWQIPNMRDTLLRIGHQRPKCFAVADLTSGFSDATTQNLSQIYRIHVIPKNLRLEACPYGLLPSDDNFQKSMCVYVLNYLLYKICEVYIDDMLILGSDDDNFISNVRTVFHRCREKNVTLNAMKLTIGKDKVYFVGHDMVSICPISELKIQLLCFRGTMYTERITIVSWSG